MLGGRKVNRVSVAGLLVYVKGRLVNSFLAGKLMSSGEDFMSICMRYKTRLKVLWEALSVCVPSTAIKRGFPNFFPTDGS